MHFVRTHADAVWNNGGLGGYVTVASDWADLDSKQFRSLNGDQGGCWAPSAAIIIGDSGNAAVPGLSVTGPALVAWGGSLKTLSSSRFVVNTANGFPKWGTTHVNRTRTIVTSCVLAIPSQPYHWIHHDDGKQLGIRSLALTIQGSTPIYSFFVLIGSTPKLEQPSFHLPIRVHDGARLTQVTLHFTVPQQRSAPPIAMPRVRVIAIDGGGNIIPLKSTTDGTGWVSMPSVTADVWMNDGVAQTFVYACDQNQTIDRSQYRYELEVIEEAGTLTTISPRSADGLLVIERKLNVSTATTTNITLSGVGFGQIIDGWVTADGQRILVKNQDNQWDNGIYIARSGTWERAADNNFIEDFTSGFCVLVKDQLTSATPQPSQVHQLWQLVAPTSPGLWKTNDSITFQRRKAVGNIYHAAECVFDLIADMRPQ